MWEQLKAAFANRGRERAPGEIETMPAPNLAVNDLLKFTARTFTQNQLGIMTCHQKVLAITGLSVTVQQVANAFAAACDANLPAALDSGTTVQNAFVELISRTTGKVLQSAIGVSAKPVGIGTFGITPKQVSAVVAKITGFAGPSNRGRVYFPFVRYDYVSNLGECTGAGGTAMATAVADTFDLPAIGTAPNTASLAPVIVHRPTTLHPLPLTDIAVTAFLATLKLGTQKRRGDYGVPNQP